MAVLLDTYMPFDSGPGASVTEAGWREMMKHVNGTASGVIRGNGNDFSVFADSTGMQVKVNTGEAWVRGHYGKSTALKTLPIAANATGATRIDRVVLRADFVNDRIEVDVLTGTASAPTATQNTSIWETSLALVSVANGAVTIAAGNVTDARSFTTVFAENSQTVGLNLTSGSNTNLTFPQYDTRCADVSLAADNFTFTLNRAGVWNITVTCGVTAPATATSTRRSLVLFNPAETVRYGETSVGSPAQLVDFFGQTTTNRYFAAGSQIKAVMNQLHGATLQTIPDRTRITFTWVGP